MLILGIDPGRVTGMSVLNTENGVVEVYNIDARGKTKESAGAMVADMLYDIEWQWSDAIVVEDFVLRYGQAVDTVSEYLLGVIDGYTGFETIKYRAGNHKNGNKAYDISKIIKDAGYKLEGDHKSDALSLALHHFKIVNPVEALQFLEGYKK